MKRETKQTLAPMFTSVSLLFVTTFLFGLGILLLLDKLGTPELIAGLASSQLSLLLYFFSLYKFDLGEIKKLKNWPTFLQFGLAILAVIPVMGFNITMSGLIKVLQLDTGKLEEFTANNAEAIMSSGSVIAILLLPVIVAPIVEELAFRAGLKYVLIDKGNWKPLYYVLFSSLLFGSLHWQPGTFTIFPILITAFLGVVNSLMYLKTKKIIVPIITHMVYNTIILLLV